MRSEVEVSEPKLFRSSNAGNANVRLHGLSRDGTRFATTLAPTTVDEAFADEAVAIAPAKPPAAATCQRVDEGSQEHYRLDDASSSGSVDAGGNGDVLRELAARLADLQTQQRQIQRLLATVQPS